MALHTHPDLLPWTPDLAARAIPHPRLRPDLHPADPQFLWTSAQQIFASLERRRGTPSWPGLACAPRDPQTWAAVCARLLASPTPVAGDPADDAHLALLLDGRQAPIIDLWVATSGLAGAARRLYEAMCWSRDPWRQQQATPHGLWLRLRAWTSAATAEERGAISLPADREGTALSAWLCPGDGRGDDLLRAILTHHERDFLAGPLLLSTESPELLALAPRHERPWTLWTWLKEEAGDEAIAPGLLASAGPAAVPLLQSPFEGSWSWLQALTRVQTDEAVAALLDQSHRPRTTGLLLELALRDPERLGRVAARRPQRAGPVHALLERARHFAAPPEPPGRPTDTPHPALLDPPWRRAARKATGKGAGRGASAAVAALPWTDTMSWRPGQKERWGRSTYCWTGGLRGHVSPVAALGKLGVPADIAAADDPGIGDWLRAHPPAGEISEHDLGVQHGSLARYLWTHHADRVVFTWKESFQGLIATWELDALDGLLLRGARWPVATMEMLDPFDCARAAPLAAAVMQRKGGPAMHGRSWLLRHPRAAVTGLLPVLQRTPDHKDTLAALRLLADEGHADLIDRVAREHGLQVPAAGPPQPAAPLQVRRLPAWLDLVSLPRPRAADGALSLDGLGALLELLSASPLAEPPELLSSVLATLEPASCAALGERLVDAWIVAEAPGEDTWVLAAAGHLRATGVLPWLELLLWTWPNEGFAAKAQLGVDVLGALGTDRALTLLHALSRRGTTPGMRSRAAQRLAEVATSRGLSPDDLADRLVPAWTSGEVARWTLGGEAVTARLTPDLELCVERADGAAHPLRGRSAAQARGELDVLREQLEQATAERVDRLERAMIYRHPLRAEDFVQHILGRPLSLNFARRLVWRSWDGRLTFRVTEDGTLADRDDRPCTLADVDAVTVLHPCQLPPPELAAWQALFADYRLTQPFPQLGRATAALLPEEQTATRLTRFADRPASTGKVMALRHLRWRWSKQGASCLTESVWWPTRDGRAVHLVVAPGLSAHGETWVNGVPVSAGQTIVSVGIGVPELTGSLGKEVFGSLSPEEQSEVVAGILTVLV